LLHLDDALRLDSYREFLAQASPPVVEELTPQRQRLLRMLIASLVDQVVRKEASLSEACTLLWRHPQVLAELRQLLDVLGERVDRVTQPLRSRPNNPLRIHARYTRLEILAGFGVGHSAKIAAWQTGVYYLAEASADLLAFTLDKSSAGFSPT